MSEISQLLATIDDASWEALGSKGLLRRAAKELEKGLVCEVAEETPFSLVVRVGDCTVTVPREGPARAKCTCGTPGCCQHVIAAGLFFRRQAASVAPPNEAGAATTAAAQELVVDRTSVMESLCGLEFSLVKQWCGAAAWRAATKLLSTGVSAEVRDEGSSLVVQLNPLGVACRFLAGTGLDGVIVTGGETKSARSFVAAAVIALKARHGQALPVEEGADAALSEEKGAPRTRAEVVDAAQSLLEMTIAAGLSHAGGGSVERFATLAVSAEGTNLPRLARSLKTIADELGLIAGRQGRADVERTLDAMAHAYALAVALRHAGDRPPALLVGQHRTGYVELHVAELIGVTAFPWQARSGFRGVTVLFWEPGEKRWSTWTEARSISGDPRFDPLRAFDGESPWAADLSVRKLVMSRVQLTHARRNAFGRLSSTQACEAKSLGPAPLAETDFGPAEFSSWEALARHVAATTAAGLKQPDPTADWVVLAPARWGGRQFDRVQQRLLWMVMDAADCPLCLAIGYSEMTKLGVERLEQWTPAAGVRVVGRFLRTGGEFVVEPIALIPARGGNFTPLHLFIPPEGSGKPAPAGKTSPPSTRHQPPDAEDELEADTTEESNAVAAGRWFRLVRERLVAVAEAGNSASHGRAEPKDRFAEKLQDAGLPLLSRAWSRLGSDETGLPASVLKTAYLVALHEQCDAAFPGG